MFGLTLSFLFLAISLSPSLLPRDPYMQGVLGGIAMASGYLIGVMLNLVWKFLEFPSAAGRSYWAFVLVGLTTGGVMVVFALINWREQQNDIRNLMEMSPVDTTRFWTILLLSLAIFLVSWVLARGFIRGVRVLGNHLQAYLPQRFSIILSTAAILVLTWNLANGLIVQNSLKFADRMFQQMDARIYPDMPAPINPLQSGSADSLIAWDTLGRQGRRFVAGGVPVETIARFHDGTAVKTPLRIYAGLNSANTVEERASLVVEEMKRVGAFKRSVLVVANPTGTGLVEQEAIAPLEVMHAGDTVVVAMQYSYLTSYLSLLVEPTVSLDAAAALANAVYEHWSQLPANDRPKFYLYGLSLGSYGSERALPLYNIITDPIHGALWSGPPFRNTVWKRFTNHRNAGSPVWLPRYRDGRFLRFAAQGTELAEQHAPWGPVRIIYLQYASDPVTFFDPNAWFREPEWMAGKRGPDVSPRLSWYPLVTMLQVAFDMAAGASVPRGYGHLYAVRDYINCWIALTDPQDWQDNDTKRLNAVFH